MSRQTAAVRIVSPAGPEHDGVLFIDHGDVVDAKFGELTGVEAVRRALRLKEGEFRVELNVRADERTIFEPWSKLVLEELVSDDEALNAAHATGSGRKQESKKMNPLEARESPRYCPSCHRRYLRGTVCADDGTQLVMGVPANGTATPRGVPRTQPTMAPPNIVTGRSNIGPIIGVVALVIAIVAGGLGFYLYRERQREAAIDAARAEQARSEAATKVSQTKRPQGVTDTEVIVGMSAPFSGPAKELGRGMKVGIDLAFASTNEAGGVNGRKLRLVALDDGYEPDRTRAVMKELAEGRNVFGFIGNVGTPTAEVAVPFTLEKK